MIGPWMVLPRWVSNPLYEIESHACYLGTLRGNVDHSLACRVAVRQSQFRRQRMMPISISELDNASGDFERLNSRCRTFEKSPSS